MLKFQDPVTKINYKFEESSGTARRRVESILTKEEGTIKWIRTFAKDDVFYDIGANIGLYTIFAAPLVQSVYAFEPHVGNMYGLLQNVAANNYKNVYPFCVALTEENKENKCDILPFNYEKLEIGSSNHQLTDIPDTTKVVEWKPAFSLDELISVSVIEYPDHIKIDVDGIELLVLNGMVDLLFRVRTVKSILCEYNPSQSRGQLDEFMAGYGFTLRDKQLTAAGKKAVARGENIDGIAHNRLYYAS
jgi:FkbM family methyltransferase